MIIKLADHRPDVNDSAVEVLEKALARVKEGEMTAVAIAYTSRGGYVGEAWSKAENTALLLGGISILQNRVANDLAAAGEAAPEAPEPVS